MTDTLYSRRLWCSPTRGPKQVGGCARGVRGELDISTHRHLGFERYTVFWGVLIGANLSVFDGKNRGKGKLSLAE